VNNKKSIMAPYLLQSDISNNFIERAKIMKLYNVTDVASILGVSKVTVHRMINRGDFPAPRFTHATKKDTLKYWDLNSINEASKRLKPKGRPRKIKEIVAKAHTEN
jgi:hypothetical protein